MPWEDQGPELARCFGCEAYIRTRSTSLGSHIHQTKRVSTPLLLHTPNLRYHGRPASRPKIASWWRLFTRSL